MKKIFKQSVTKHNLFYISLCGDGDSKAFPEVENTYDLEKHVKKYECIGHYQKRVGRCLQKIKKCKRARWKRPFD